MCALLTAQSVQLPALCLTDLPFLHYTCPNMEEKASECYGQRREGREEPDETAKQLLVQRTSLCFP